MKGKKKWIRMLALFAAVLTLPLTGKAVNGKQEALNYEADCSLQVKVVNESQAEEAADQLKISELLNLQRAGEIEVDLYRVADLKKDGSHDTFTYEMLPAYADIKVGGQAVQEAANGLLDNESAEMQSAISQALAEVVRANPGAAAVTGAAGEGYINIPKDADGESVGLYLLFVRERGVSLADSFVDVEADGEPGVATRIESDHYTFDFSPQLVTFPWMEPDNNGEPQYPWIYVREVNLNTKYSSGYRLGNLEISKTLNAYREGSPVTFVFQVEARDEEDNVYYSNVVDIRFDGTGTQTAVIEGKIRYGTNVTVTEVYSGAAYELVGGNATQTVSIAPDSDTAQAAFTNDFNNSVNGGGAVVNSFEPNEDGSGWTWSQNGTVRAESGPVAVQEQANPENSQLPVEPEN